MYLNINLLLTINLILNTLEKAPRTAVSSISFVLFCLEVLTWLTVKAFYEPNSSYPE